MDDIRHTLCVINAQIACNISVPKHLVVICRHIFPLPQKDCKPLRIILEPDGLQKQEKKRILLHQIGLHLQNLLLQVKVVNSRVPDFACQFQNRESGDIIVQESIVACLADKVMKEQAFADAGLFNDLVGAGMAVAVLCEYFKAGIDHAVLFFLL